MKSREEIITVYERIKSKWDNDGELIRILPEVYKDICFKLESLKAGAGYTITDKTDELKTMIAYVGGQIPSINKKAKGQYINVNNRITYEQAQVIAKEF